jgi:mycothiol synthase
MLEIRFATESDYPRISQIWNAIEPDHHVSAEALLEASRLRDPKYQSADFVALSDDEIVAHANYAQSIGTYHPQKFGVWFHVPLDHWHEGVQDRLYDHVLRDLERFDPISLRSNSREHRPYEIEWLLAKGFHEVQRNWESRLQLDAFDAARWASKVARVKNAGFHFKALSGLKDTPEFRQALYDLWCEVRRDVPRPEAVSEVSFEQFVKRNFENQNLLSDAYLVALDEGGQFVATTALWRSFETDVLEIGLTGTRVHYRRQGLAFALKIESLAWAKAQGYAEVRTSNALVNTGILRINDALGFERQSANIKFLKTM